MDHSPFLLSATQDASQRPYIRFILSRGAGKGNAHALAQEIRSCYPHATHSELGGDRRQAGRVTISLTRGPDHVQKLAAEWNEFWGKKGVCYVAGGDGSVNEVVQALAGKDCAFGVIPMGTGNDFARSLYGEDVGYRDALSLISATKNVGFSPIDVLQVNDLYCANVFSLGYDTEVLREAMRVQRRFRALGSSAYGLGVARTLWREKSVPLAFSYHDIAGEHHQIEQACTVFVVGNGRMYGGGYQPLPDALLDDAHADFLYSDSLSLLGIGRLLAKYRDGSHTESPVAHMDEIVDLHVERIDGESLLWNIDGLIYESDAVDIKNIPSAVTLARLVPGVQE
ncbi:diacylglycerol/lipid kinase family protein [Arcanobacterium phocae]|uniref:diacylglycerol/lipid kinase family protein n=1 Tax=Arcanobacterium phocae TaxID=131112 RepID=UPI001C0F393D|nr:diacylglycerol kinase family protein [Arcanobacterium phocae]